MGPSGRTGRGDHRRGRRAPAPASDHQGVHPERNGEYMAKRGRPRTFDREEAVRQARDVFWALGYEGATLADLQRAMGGITAPSFYAAFGSKEQLFREVI